MKISKQTIDILQNFSAINEGINFRKGNIISTIEPYNVIVAKAVVEEEFPRNCSIGDLKTFLTVLNSFESPNLSFGATSVKISENNKAVNYVYATGDIKSPPENIPEISGIIEFSLSEKDFQTILKMATVMHLPNIVIRGDGERIFLCAENVENEDAGNFVIDTGTETNKEFSAIFQLPNIKIIPSCYNMKIQENVAHLSNSEMNLEYWVAVEKGSKF